VAEISPPKTAARYNPPTVKTPVSISPGSRLGPYEIQSPLGAGGMGEVYKALDTRLNRTAITGEIEALWIVRIRARLIDGSEHLAVNAATHSHEF
jgi:serine/threonine protein kinase